MTLKDRKYGLVHDFGGHLPHRKPFVAWTTTPQFTAQRSKLWNYVRTFINDKGDATVVGKELCKFVLSDPGGHQFLINIHSTISSITTMETVKSFPTLLFEWEIIPSKLEVWEREKLASGHVVYEARYTSLIDHELSIEEIRHEAMYGEPMPDKEYL